MEFTFRRPGVGEVSCSVFLEAMDQTQTVIVPNVWKGSVLIWVIMETCITDFVILSHIFKTVWNVSEKETPEIPQED